MTMRADDGRIPIRNVYALLAYAWNFLDMTSPTDVSAIEADTPTDLLARLLANGLHKLLRRGLYRAYIEHAEELRNPRGAIDVARTVTGALRARGRVACRFDELSCDVLENRVLKATARTLYACRGVESRLALSLRDACSRLDEVSSIELRDPIWRDLRVPRGHGIYGMLFDICRLVNANLLPEEDGTGYRLRDFTRDDDQMAHLFEQFVRGFLQYHLGGDDVKIGRERLGWLGASGGQAALGLLPRMMTDISVRTPEGCTIIETKFVRQPFRELEKGARLKLRSDHLYQIFAYLKNTREHGAAAIEVDGILLYASVGRGLSETLMLGRNRLSIRTVDLGAPWEDIRVSLLGLPLRRSASWAQPSRA